MFKQVQDTAATNTPCIAIVELCDIIHQWQGSWAAQCQNTNLLERCDEAYVQLDMASGNLFKYRRRWHNALLELLHIALEIQELIGADEEEFGASWDMQYLGGESFALTWTEIDGELTERASWEVRVEDGEIHCTVEWNSHERHFLPGPSECIEQEHDHGNKG